MAENLTTLKRRIKTAVNISQIAKAMEMISASKIRKAKEAVENNRPYAQKIYSTVQDILHCMECGDFDDVFTKHNGSKRRLLIAISPDKGLCGSLNENIFKKILKYGENDVSLITVGKKAEKFGAKMGYPLEAAFSMGTALPKYGAVYPVLQVAIDLYRKGTVGEVALLYTDFKGMMNQEPVVQQLLPITLEKQPGKKQDTVFTFEPGIESILSELLPYYIEVRLYNALINAFTSEQAARMVSMQNAKNNALDIRDSITLAYNKLRQSKITGEILDITNSSFA